MSEITGYNASWDNHTGQEVENFIKDRLQDHESNISQTEAALNDKVSNISFESAGNSSIRYTLYSNAQKTEAIDSGTFDLVAFSGTTGRITIQNTNSIVGSENNAPFIIKEGSSYTINYTLVVEDESQQKIVVPASASNNISLTFINGNTSHEHPNIAKTGKTSRAEVDPVYSFTIPASDLKEGENHIYISANVMYRSQSVYIEPAEFVLYVLNPVLKVSVPSDNGLNKLRTLQDNFKLNFDTKSSKNTVIKINNIIDKYIITDIIYQYYKRELIY